MGTLDADIVFFVHIDVKYDQNPTIKEQGSKGISLLTEI